MPTNTDSISHPAINSASSTAFLIDSTVPSIFTTTPLRRPREGYCPNPMISTWFSLLISPMMQHILVVPISRPTM